MYHLTSRSEMRGSGWWSTTWKVLRNGKVKDVTGSCKTNLFFKRHTSTMVTNNFFFAWTVFFFKALYRKFVIWTLRANLLTRVKFSFYFWFFLFVFNEVLLAILSFLSALAITLCSLYFTILLCNSSIFFFVKMHKWQKCAK